MKLKIRTLILIASCSAAFLTAACGKSLYSAFSKKETNESKLEDAKIALDKNEFSKARSILSGLWNNQKSSDIAQLYVIAMLGSVDLDIFTLVKKTLELSDKEGAGNLSNEQIYSNFPAQGAAAGNKKDGAKNESPGNDIVDKIAEVLPTDLDSEEITETLKSAINVLHEKKGDASVTPLTCFVGAIYTHLVVTSSQKTLSELNTTMATNIQKIGPTCAESTANEAGTNIQNALKDVTQITAALDELIESASDCLGSEASVNSIKTQLDKLYAKADTGCNIGTAGVSGVPGFPTCASTFIEAAGGSDSKANDKALDGCELFTNCVGNTGACF